MSAISYVPIIAFRGDKPWTFPFFWKLSDGITPRDISAVTIAGHVKWTTGSIDLNVGNGGIVITSAIGGSWNVIVDISRYTLVPDGERSYLILWFLENGVELTRAMRPLRVIER
jgi:hypothetical protein